MACSHLRFWPIFCVASRVEAKSCSLGLPPESLGGALVSAHAFIETNTMARICLINPRFPVSFWGLNHGLPILGKKANMPVLAMPVLAGLTPPGHEVVLIDANIRDIDFAELKSFDIVGLTGMTVQRDRMREILV